MTVEFNDAIVSLWRSRRFWQCEIDETGFTRQPPNKFPSKASGTTGLHWYISLVAPSERTSLTYIHMSLAISSAGVALVQVFTIAVSHSPTTDG